VKTKPDCWPCNQSHVAHGNGVVDLWMLQILLLHFCVAHVVFKFEYHVHADLELDLVSRSRSRQHPCRAVGRSIVQ